MNEKERVRPVENEKQETDKIDHKKNTERHAPRESHREIDSARVDARALRRKVVCNVL